MGTDIENKVQKERPSWDGNSTAENVAATLAKVVLGAGIVIFVIGLIGSLVQFSGGEPESGWNAILTGIIALAAGAIGWAVLNLLCHISLSLIAIREELKK